MVRFVRSTCPLVHGWLNFVRRWSISCWAQAKSKRVHPTTLMGREHLPNLTNTPTRAGFRELKPVVGQHGGDPVRDVVKQPTETVRSDPTIDAVALQPVQRGPGQVRNRRLQRVEAIIKGHTRLARLRHLATVFGVTP